MTFKTLPTSDYPELSSALQGTDRNRPEFQTSSDTLRHLKHMLLAFASRFHAVVDAMTPQGGVIQINGRKGDAKRLQEALLYHDKDRAFDDFHVDPSVISCLIKEGILGIDEENLNLDQVLNGFLHRIAHRISFEAAMLHRQLSSEPLTVTVPTDDVFYMIQRDSAEHLRAIKNELLTGLSYLLPHLQVVDVAIDTMNAHPNEIKITVQAKEIVK